MSHVMLSYQWDHQALVKRIYDRLKEDGLPVWMDIEGGVKAGNINDAMAAGVEEAAVICSFMTPAYQASRSCKKELNYADTREVIVVPVMLTKNWDSSSNLGFENSEESEDHLERCIQSLQAEIMFHVGHLLTLQEPLCVEEDDREEGPPSRKPSLKKKPGRGFRHALSGLYLRESGEQKFHVLSETRNTVELQEHPGDNGYWEEIKGNYFKHFRNVVTNGYLGFDPCGDCVYTKASPYGAEKWLLVVDGSDHTRERERAVVIKTNILEGYWLSKTATLLDWHRTLKIANGT